MKKTRIKPDQLKKILDRHGLQKYDVCKICNVSGATAERWFKQGIPDAFYRLIALSLGDL